MKDRDSLEELFPILYEHSKDLNLVLTQKALLYVKDHLGMGCDIYYRRRLSVCRMLIDFNLQIDNAHLDILLAATLANHMPGDSIPEDMDETFAKMYADQPEVWKTLDVLKHRDYSDKEYYKKLVLEPYPLIIRLTERSVLLEKLYEWAPVDALKFVRETREDFFPMCIYAKEHYPGFLGAASLLHEKMRNLCAVNDVLLSRFVETENAIRDEILSLKEENAVVRAMIKDLEKE